jgi:hypothetical protein
VAVAVETKVVVRVLVAANVAVAVAAETNCALRI